VVIASVVDMHQVPRLMRKMGESALNKRYEEVVAGLKEGQDPAAYVVMCPDWKGEVPAALGLPDLGTELGVAVIAADGTVAGVYRGMEPLETVAEQVAAALDTPVMADESAWTPQDVLEIVERRAADMISVYTTKPGGLHRAMQVAAVAEAAGLRCNVNGSAETGVGNAANVQLAAAARAVTLSCVIPVSTPAGHQRGQLAGIYYRDDLVAEPFRFADGCVLVPDGPGMGVAVDEAKVAKYRVS